MLLLQDQSLSFHSITIQELERKLHFSYIPQITFKHPELKQHLFEEGQLRYHKKMIEEQHLENGQKYRKYIETSFIPKVSIRFINHEIGYGLFVEEDLQADTYFGEYVGLIRRNNDHLFISNYLYAYPIVDEIGRNFVIDAHTGCLTRFINHSYDPLLHTTFAYIDGFYHMIFLTNRPIKKGTQVTFNYGKNYWITRSSPKNL